MNLILVTTILVLLKILFQLLIGISLGLGSHFYLKIIVFFTKMIGFMEFIKLAMIYVFLLDTFIYHVETKRLKISDLKKFSSTIDLAI